MEHADAQNLAKPPFMCICCKLENWRDLRALSGKFLRQKSCFLWLWRLMANTILNFHFNYLHTSLISKANLSRTEWLLLRESGLASALSRNSLNRFERIKNSYFMFLKIWKCVIVGQLRRQPLLEEDRSDVLHFQDKPHCTGLNLSLRLVYLPLRIL